MKRLIALLIVALIPALSHAQLIAVQNEAGAVKAPDAGDTSNNVAVDSALRLLVSVASGTSDPLAIIPVSNSAGLNGTLDSINGYYNVGTDTIEAASTTTVLNLTSHVARKGDLIYPTGGTAGNIGVQIPVCSVAANSVTLCYPLPATPSTDAITIRRPAPLFTPLEDSVHVSGDAGVQMFGVSNETAANLSADGDYTPFATHISGAQLVNIWQPSIPAAARGASIVKGEDVAHTSGDVGVAALFLAESAITNSAPTNDYINPKADTGGRVVITGAPAGETWQGCGTATASTADVAIKAAVPSNRSYVTAITCASSDADNATNINFKDATTVIAVGGVSQMAAGAAGTFTATFPTPLRTTANTAFNFNTAVSTSSVICCATGYISTI